MKKEKQKTHAQLVYEAEKFQFSEGAKFMIALKWKKCFYKDKAIDKWELWAMGFRNAETLKANIVKNIVVL